MNQTSNSRSSWMVLGSYLPWYVLALLWIFPANHIIQTFSKMPGHQWACDNHFQTMNILTSICLGTHSQVNPYIAPIPSFRANPQWSPRRTSSKALPHRPKFIQRHSEALGSGLCSSSGTQTAECQKESCYRRRVGGVSWGACRFFHRYGFPERQGCK